jgi:hypothetical protein
MMPKPASRNIQTRKTKRKKVYQRKGQCSLPRGRKKYGTWILRSQSGPYIHRCWAVVWLFVYIAQKQPWLSMHRTPRCGPGFHSTSPPLLDPCFRLPRLASPENYWCRHWYSLHLRCPGLDIWPPVPLYSYCKPTLTLSSLLTARRAHVLNLPACRALLRPSYIPQHHQSSNRCLEKDALATPQRIHSTSGNQSKQDSQS